MPDCLVIDFTLRLNRSESSCKCCGPNHIFGIDMEMDAERVGSDVDVRRKIFDWLYERRFALEGKRLRLIVEPV